MCVMWRLSRFLLLCYSVLLLMFAPASSVAQYFGRNKVLYQNFDFRVFQTPHFEIYTYLKDQGSRSRFLQNTEQWYLMHQRVLRDTFKERNPFILYNHHAHFQQTRAIGGEISVGTGGVTEGLKNRVILPFLESNAQTDHVVGHELVHAFQYHLVKDSFSLNALNNLPLWMVEGMAEYMSIGYVDANTAMWLRSAVQNNQLPTLRDLTRRPDLYFPYRWGQAFWAYTTGRFGDDVIRRLFLETARVGVEEALKRVLKLDEKTFSAQWQEAIRSHFAPLQGATTASPVGRRLIDNQNGGRLNIVPSISPDGKFVAYWTEKNLFSLDLFIADAATGKNIERVTKNSFNSHIDQYSSYESSVAWSPDSRQLAFVAFAKGRNQLVIVNTHGKVERQVDIPGVDGFANPTWSPDGTTIVVSGIVEGQSDLFAYNIQTKSVRRLTNDIYSDLQPSFSPDGRTIIFATDRLSMQGNRLQHTFSHNIALLDVNTGAITQLDFFPGANNLDPEFASDNSIVFLSDRDGFRNLYRYDLSVRSVQQLTNFFTGIAGITLYAPAISISRQTGDVLYTYYTNREYTIYSTPLTALTATQVSSSDVSQVAATLPPASRQGMNLVQQQLQSPPALASNQLTVSEQPYRPQFQLDYIGNTGIGIQTGGGFGTGLAGGVNGLFSDILGNNQLFGALSLNGELVDVAGQAAYFNQNGRINWGASISHIPYISGQQYLLADSIQNRQGQNVKVLNSALDILRTFEDQLSVFAQYPFSPIRRVEAGASFARYYYRLDRYNQYYDTTGQFYLGQDRERQPTPGGFNFGNTYVAIVGDNSFFGVASPLAGHRFRLEGAQYFGVINIQNITADYRKYIRLAPVSFATRNLFIGRFGRDAETGVLPPLFLGYPTLVRGYDALTYSEGVGSLPLTINDLIGSRMYVTNFEVRLPFTGPERLSVIKSNFLFTELNLFTDGGITWGNRQQLPAEFKRDQVTRRTSRFVLSSGISLRINLFGYLILEPFYAIPWQNGGFRNASFGFNFTPGW